MTIQLGVGLLKVALMVEKPVERLVVAEVAAEMILEVVQMPVD